MEEHPVPLHDEYDWWGVYRIMTDTSGGMIIRSGTRTISAFTCWKKEMEWPDLSLGLFKVMVKSCRR